MGATRRHFLGIDRDRGGGVGVVNKMSIVDVRPTSVRRSWAILAVGTLLLAALAGVMVGPVELNPIAVLAELGDRLPFIDIGSGFSEQESAILWQLRMPRVVLGGIVGAMLALAGTAYQGVFRNPLADPYLLGVAAGAGLGATLAIAYFPGARAWPIDPLPLAAFAGALLGVSITYALGRAPWRGRTTAGLILAGVATASFLTAIQTYIQQREDDTIRQVYTWILGHLTTATWREVALVMPYLVLSTAVILLHRRLLDMLSVGDEEA